MRAGICTPICRVVTFRCDVDWMKRVGVNGIVIGRHVLFSQKGCHVPQHIFRHELEHCYQQIRDGRVLFYLKYSYYSLRYGYKNNPYELEADDRSTRALTINEEQLLCRLRGSSENSLSV